MEDLSSLVIYASDRHTATKSNEMYEVSLLGSPQCTGDSVIGQARTVVDSI